MCVALQGEVPRQFLDPDFRDSHNGVPNMDSHDVPLFVETAATNHCHAMEFFTSQKWAPFFELRVLTENS